MAKSDLQARPVYHRTRDPSIRKFVKAARRYRTIDIQAGDHATTAADRYPPTSGTPSARSATPRAVRTSLTTVR